MFKSPSQTEIQTFLRQLNNTPNYELQEINNRPERIYFPIKKYNLFFLIIKHVKVLDVTKKNIMSQEIQGCFLQEYKPTLYIKFPDRTYHYF